MSKSNSRNVTFKMDNLQTENIYTSKKLSLLDPERDKRRNSRVTSGSFDILSTKNSLNKTRRSRPSILLLDNRLKNNFSNSRFDAFGNKIIKGTKNHKVTFIDQISSDKIAEVILIESSYMIEKQNEMKKKDNICYCNTCFIF